jgi:hypothetical protein
MRASVSANLISPFGRLLQTKDPAQLLEETLAELSPKRAFLLQNGKPYCGSLPFFCTRKPKEFTHWKQARHPLPQ